MVGVVALGLVALGVLIGVRLEARGEHRPAPLVAIGNRWQVFTVPPGSAEFSPDVTLGGTYADALINAALNAVPERPVFDGPHWRAVDCRKPPRSQATYCRSVWR